MSVSNHPAAHDASREKRLRVVAALALGVMTAFGLPAHAQTSGASAFTMPAIVSPASQERHTGKVVFVELVTPDLASTKTFYSALFGWTFSDVPVGQTVYSQASLDGNPVAGVIQTRIASGDHRQPAWLTFMSTPDVDATGALAVQHGAKQLLAPRMIPGRGKEAIYADPQGAVFGVLASGSGDPPDVTAAPGEWVWSALVARDPDKDAGFYQTLFNYDVYELPSDGTNLHLILASDHFSRASANGVPEHAGNVLPHWLNFIRVDDAVASAAKVQSLGGQVLVTPHVDRHGGKIAVVADPNGAPFGLMELGVQEAESPGAAK